MGPSYSFMDLLFLLPVMFIPTVIWLVVMLATGGGRRSRSRAAAAHRAATSGVAGVFAASRPVAVDDNDPDAFRSY